MILSEELLDQHLLNWLKEDLPFFDVSNSFIPEREGKAYILTREDIVVAGIPVVARLYKILGVRTNPLVKDGDQISKDQKLIEITGSLRKILQGERVALNIFSRMCGIATMTKSLIDRAKKHVPGIRIAATRKTTPGLRLFEKYAVVVAGGEPHRFSLSDCVMIKDNHISIFGSVSKAMNAARKNSSFTTKIEIEVETIEQALEAAKARADIIMLDNFKPEKIKEAITLIREHHPSAIIELSGGITPSNLEKYLIPGVNVISMGFLTHSTKNADLSLEILSSF